jgi:predicted DNA-binding protein
MATYMNGPSKTLGFRLPVTLLQEIEKIAKCTDRTVNRVVVRMLQAQIEQEKKGQAS